ncbi:MAG: hypothetical protein ISQ97_03440, partial [Flavobacteriales bacterium]|nr:hypothetical protein [Flavobacteriales bacterium]
MKQFTLALALGLFVCSGMAQSSATPGAQLLHDIPQLAPALRTAAPMPTMAVADFSDRPQQPLEGESTLDIEHVMSREMIVERQVIGYTQYDLQSNATIDDRMAGGAEAI